jgi:tRNA U55 pseudouridine synthase TruB
MIHGKPLFWWARRNRLINISIPTKNITIYKLKLLSMEKISKTRLTSLIKTKINKVAGDFRQEIIMQKWQDLLQKNKKEKFITSTFKLHCSSGTYVRSLVNKLGNEFQTGAVTLDIFRTKVGDYDYRNSVKLSRLVRPVTVL